MNCNAECEEPQDRRINCRQALDWAHHLETSYSDRILNIDREIVHVWGELTANAQIRGKVVHVSDGLIAATALVHGLHVITRNISDFEPTGVLILNPWA